MKRDEKRRRETINNKNKNCTEKSKYVAESII